MIWLRRRKNRHGVERIPVEVVGRTPSGCIEVQYRRANLTIARALVQPKNLIDD
jgi:hypothetical protein